MRWPTPQDYNEALQNPRLAFTDLDLRFGQPELTPIGLPRPICGKFACVYKMRSNGERWAARCFMTYVPDQQRRYAAISQCLTKANLRYTVPFTYLSSGIKLQGRSYPLVKMQWVQGEPLNAFVGRNVWYPQTLLSLAKGWLQVIAALKALNIAHGDLQHGNILVTSNQIQLIDYDGMFVSALAGNESNELGHRNYQLPSRSRRDYGPYLDNFSAWVIYVSLIALAVHPELWSTYDGGDECLIFRKEDFMRPKSSGILCDLMRSPNDQLRVLIDSFVRLFFLSPQDISAPNGNLPQITVTPRTPWWQGFPERPPPRPQPTPPAPRRNSYSGLWIGIAVLGAVILLGLLNTTVLNPPNTPIPASPSPTVPTPVPTASGSPDPPREPQDSVSPTPAAPDVTPSVEDPYFRRRRKDIEENSADLAKMNRELATLSKEIERELPYYNREPLDAQYRFKTKFWRYEALSEQARAQEARLREKIKRYNADLESFKAAAQQAASDAEIKKWVDDAAKRAEEWKKRGRP
jgi:hypothetical protein